MKRPFLLICRLALLAGTSPLLAQTSAPAAPAILVPEWAIPGSATHKQVPPPRDFHREAVTDARPIGIFDGQSDIGAALVAGSANYDAALKAYTIDSAGYNIWYSRDEFRFIWKRMSGDVSLAADVAFPNVNGYGDRKAVLVIRQSLDDDSKQVVVALHGLGMLQLARRVEKGALTTDREFRIGGRGRPQGASPDSLVNDVARRIGIEKHGKRFALFVSVEGEPMTQYGPPVELELDGPFYVGIGFCSHLPDVVDSAVLTDVVLANKAGKVR
jgi:hypothetical protein